MKVDIRTKFSKTSHDAPVKNKMNTNLTMITSVGAVLSMLAYGGVLAATLPTSYGWHTIANSKIDNVCAGTHGFPVVLGIEGCSGILSWSGGIFDSKRDRLIVWGGGHTAYYGNELYAFNLSTLTMTRLNDPGLPLNDCQEAIAGGTQPSSRHTYDGIEYLQNVDRMFVFGGAITCAAGGFGKGTWTFDFATMKWQRMTPSGAIPSGALVASAYDPNSGLVFLHDSNDLYSYDYNKDEYKRLASGNDIGYHAAATIDPKRRLFVVIGRNANTQSGQVLTYDISGAAPVRVVRKTVGGEALINSTYPGIDYDPILDRIVAWNGGDSVFSLNLDTNAWSTHTFSGGPGAASPNRGHGTHGRWRYSAKSGVYVLVNNSSQDTILFRISNQSGTGTDTTPPSAPQNLTVK